MISLYMVKVETLFTCSVKDTIRIRMPEESPPMSFSRRSPMIYIPSGRHARRVRRVAKFLPTVLYIFRIVRWFEKKKISVRLYLHFSGGECE